MPTGRYVPSSSCVSRFAAPGCEFSRGTCASLGNVAVSVRSSVLTGGVPLRPTRALPFRLIPRIETYPGVVSLVQTIPGKAALLAVFGLLYAWTNPAALPLVLCLALLTWM